MNLDEYVSYLLVSHISLGDARECISIQFSLAFFLVQLSLEDFERFLHIEFEKEVAHELISGLASLVLQIGCYDFTLYFHSSHLP